MGSHGNSEMGAFLDSRVWCFRMRRLDLGVLLKPPKHLLGVVVDLVNGAVQP